MHGVPRIRGTRKKIRAGVERSELVVASIIAELIARALDARYSGAVIFPPERHGGPADGVSVLVENFSKNDGGRGQLQDEIFCVHACAGDDGSGELLVLVVGGTDVTALGPAKGVFAGGNLKLEVPVIGGELG